MSVCVSLVFFGSKPVAELPMPAKLGKHAPPPTVKLCFHARRIIRCLRKLHAPPEFIEIVRECYLQALVPHGISLTDYFAGVAEPARAAHKRGRVAVTFELKDDAVEQNMISDAGYVTAVCVALGSDDGGQSSYGTPCNSFVFMSSSLNARSWANPLGNQRHGFVRKGNQIIYRTVIGILF